MSKSIEELRTQINNMDTLYNAFINNDISHFVTEDEFEDHMNSFEDSIVVIYRVQMPKILILKKMDYIAYRQMYNNWLDTNKDSLIEKYVFPTLLKWCDDLELIVEDLRERYEYAISHYFDDKYYEDKNSFRNYIEIAEDVMKSAKSLLAKLDYHFMI